jgi:hypothetical protein
MGKSVGNYWYWSSKENALGWYQLPRGSSPDALKRI